MMLVWLFVCCFQSETVKEAQQIHHDLAALHKQYLEGIRLYTSKEYTRSIDSFQELHTQYPNSRAVLEGLLLAELESSSQFDIGYDRVKRYLERNPGDSAFRLLQAKYHLKSNKPSLANDDLEVLLFNQSIHPWQLAQDTFVRAYRQDLNNEKIPFDLIIVTQFEVPQVVVVGDPFEIRLSVLHLDTCAVQVSKATVGLNLEPVHLRVYEEDVDDIVQKTTLVQGFQSLAPAHSTLASMVVQCGEAEIEVALPAIQSIALQSVEKRNVTSIIEFPDVRLLPKKDDGVPWSLYTNNIEVYNGFWTYDK